MSDINGFKDPAPSPNPTAKRGGFAPARGEEAKKTGRQRPCPIGIGEMPSCPSPAGGRKTEVK
ncbi:hypothetical protein [Methylovulum psychrotolerans]|uniref:hypothetical protein n=1 Tax=Methylovulum psychrotolerans TaxID=1704499 RepID=UPI000CDF1A91|nr:hypothetical protein [Methylovulum psychrotolerans]